jgi:zinc transport system substrate-binding protein
MPRSRLACPLVLAGLLAGLVSALGGCGGGGDRAAVAKAPKAPKAAPISVAASVYPLAQLISYIGGPLVRVTNLAPPGAQPEGLRLGPDGLASLRSARLVVDVGDGYQPAVEAAARRAAHHLAVLPAVSKQAKPYEFWLDPALMSKAAKAVSEALTVADPAGRRQFHNGWLDFQSVAASLESDFYNSLTTCSKSEIVTANDAFGRLAADFGLKDLAVSSTGVAKAASFVEQYSLPAVFSETGSPSALVKQVAARAHVRVRALGPLELTPSPGSPHLSYFSEMEQDLSALESGLACDTSENFS